MLNEAKNLAVLGAAIAFNVSCFTGVALAQTGTTDTASLAMETTSPGLVLSDSSACMPSGPPPKANAAMQKVLDEMAKSPGKPMETLTPEEARKQPSPGVAVSAIMVRDGKTTDSLPETKVTAVDKTIPGPGGEIAIRIYTPPVVATKYPVIVYYHGGGWVIADLDTYDSSARALSLAAGAVVVSSHYRQAPEHKFPAAHDDALAAYEWTLKNMDAIKGDSENVALAGESAGGNLATVTAMSAKRKSLKMPSHQLLIYPVTEHGTFDNESYKENATAKPLNCKMMGWFWNHYLGSPMDGSNPMASPLKADEKDLSGLPPATIILAEIDPLRTEGEQYGEKLKDAGVDVNVKHYKGVVHEFFGMGAVVPDAKEAVEYSADQLKKSWE